MNLQPSALTSKFEHPTMFSLHPQPQDNMDRFLASQPAMEVSPIVRQSIDSEGRRGIQRKDGEVPDDFGPQHLTTSDTFDDRDVREEWLKKQLKSTSNNDFESSESSTRGSEQPTVDSPKEAIPDDFNPYDELGQVVDSPPYYAREDGLQPAPQVSIVPIPRNSVSMMAHPQRLRHGVLIVHPQSMPYVVPTAHQFTHPVLTNAPPMISHRQPAPQTSIQPVLTSPGPVASSAQPVPQLFTAPCRLEGRFRQLTEAQFFEVLPPELEVRIFKYALKADQPFYVAYNGQIDSHTKEMQNLLFISHATKEKYPGLLYRQNVFLCEHANSVSSLLRQPIEVTSQILHVDLAVGVVSQARFDELRKLRGLRTIRIIGVRGHHTGYDPAITHNPSTAQRLQEIELAVQTTLNCPAVRSTKTASRFVASQRAVRELVKKRKVKVTFMAQYNVYTYPHLQRNQYETVFEIMLVGGKSGYGLQLGDDKLVRIG